MNARRGKQIAVLLALAAMAAVGYAPTRDWVAVTAPEVDDFSVTGAALSPALPALGLAIAALTLALMFSRRRLALVIAVVLAIIGAGVTLLALRAPAPDAAAVRLSIEHRTGVTHIRPTTFEVDWSMPALTVVGGGVALAAAAWIFATSHRWRRVERSADRYERDGSLAWDALDDGEDPTEAGRSGESLADPADDSDYTGGVPSEQGAS